MRLLLLLLRLRWVRLLVTMASTPTWLLSASPQRSLLLLLLLLLRGATVLPPLLLLWPAASIPSLKTTSNGEGVGIRQRRWSH